MAVKKRRPVVIACVSDLHCGGTTALCPPKVMLDDGGSYSASRLQLLLWQNWGDYCDFARARRDALDAELWVIFNGDLVEGDHHKTTQILSGNPNAQAFVVNAAMRVMLDLKPDKLFFVRGTEAHVGQSASAEERIADGLWRDKRPVQRCPDTETASWWHLTLEEQGVRIDVTHHGKMGRLPRTRRSNLVLYAWDILDEHAEQNVPLPHLCLRGHNHKKGDSGDACPVRVVATGCWQMNTSHVHKVAADSLPDIGGVLVTIQNGEFSVEKKYFPPAPRAVWRNA